MSAPGVRATSAPGPQRREAGPSARDGEARGRRCNRRTLPVPPAAGAATNGAAPASVCAGATTHGRLRRVPDGFETANPPIEPEAFIRPGRQAASRRKFAAVIGSPTGRDDGGDALSADTGSRPSHPDPRAYGTRSEFPRRSPRHLPARPPSGASTNTHRLRRSIVIARQVRGCHPTGSSSTDRRRSSRPRSNSGTDRGRGFEGASSHRPVQAPGDPRSGTGSPRRATASQR